MPATSKISTKPKIQVGYRVGKVCVEAPTDQRKNGYTIWRCRCDCGTELFLDTRSLQRGAIRDCGCVSNVRPGQKDLTGQRFGRLVCIEPTDQRGSGGGILWRCRCDCGNECLAASRQLVQGYKKSCGCLGHPPLKDYVGRRFGMLTVQEYAGKKDGLHRWKCRCDCGKETIVGQTSLQSGHTKSCGCKGRLPLEDLTGRRFGQLTVIEKVENEKGALCWRCRCDCGAESTVRHHYLISGHTKSCGHLRKTAYKKTLQLIDGTSVTLIEANRKRLISTNKSGCNGVYLHTKNRKWVAQVTFRKKTYYLGSYDELGEARRARKEGEQIQDSFLEWYYTNYPERRPKG